MAGRDTSEWSLLWVIQNLDHLTRWPYGNSFFYVDERKPDGSSKGMAIDGPAHGKFIASLIAKDGDVPWLATFVAGEGYKKFERSQLWASVFRAVEHEVTSVFIIQ
jgi:hypothetical protein